MAITAELAQTFFIDPQLVKGSSTAFITSVDLYFGRKPTRGTSSSNLPAPGVTVFLTPTIAVGEELVPNLEFPLKGGRSRKEYSEITTSTDSSVATTFTFETPVPVSTDKKWAVVIKFDGSDTGYALWRNKSSEDVVDSNLIATSVTKGALDGKFFVITNGSVPTPLNDSDLKITIKVSKFTTSNTSFRVVNRNYEFIRFNTSTLTGNFVGGELVFANTGFPSAQTISVSSTSKTITGTSTKFQDNFPVGSYIVLNSGTSNDIKQVTAVASNTSLTVDSFPSFTNSSSKYLVAPIARVFDYMPEANSLVLIASTANSTVKYAATQTVHGTKSGAVATISSLWNFPVHSFNPEFNAFIPAGTSVNTSVQLANTTYYTQNSSGRTYKLEMGKKREFNDFGAYIYSRSVEVDNPSNLNYGKSAIFNVTMSTDNEYSSPLLRENDLNYFLYRYEINNTANNENKQYGSAKAKYISKKITLADGQDAEDIRVYLTAYKPAYTDIKLYAKILSSLDSQTFDSKDWSELELKSPKTLISNAENPNDFIELEYKFPNYPVANSETGSSGYLHPLVFTGTNGSANLTGSALQVNAVSATFNALSAVSNTADFITVSSNPFTNTDYVTYTVATGNTAVGGLTSGSNYYVVQANSTGVKLSLTEGGSAINITAGVSETGHTLNAATRIAVNDLVRVYSPLNPNTSMVAAVTAVNQANITLGFALSSSNSLHTAFITNGLRVERVKNKNSAFNNYLNSGVVRYFDTNMGAQDTYKVFAFKIVFLSSSDIYRPVIDNIRGIALSA